MVVMAVMEVAAAQGAAAVTAEISVAVGMNCETGRTPRDSAYLEATVTVQWIAQKEN